jgi:hypothetical protein
VSRLLVDIRAHLVAFRQPFLRPSDHGLHHAQLRRGLAHSFWPALFAPRTWTH